MSPIPNDVQDFLDGYPDSDNGATGQSVNLLFYSNLLRCRPDGLLIDELHENWEGDYHTLERNHGYIQWLFPIQEYGLNQFSQPLQRHEISIMKENPEIIERLLTSYKLMLDFYGLQLINEDTGCIGKSSPPKDSPSRFRHLNSSFHNYLRITRILKCLSEMGLEILNAGFILGVLNYQSELEELQSLNLINSMDRWWANCIRNDDERQFVKERILAVRRGKSVWTRELYKAALERRAKTGRF